MIRRLLLLIACVLLAAPVTARAVEVVLEGEVGPSPIVMKLDVDGASAFGSYFYRRTLFDIDLSGDVSVQVRGTGDVRDGAIKLESRLTGDKLTLNKRGSGYVGTLTTSGGKTLAVALRPAKLETLRDAPPDLDHYERLRLTGLSLVAGPTTKVGGKAIRWYVEPRSKIELFRLDGGYPPAALAAINRALAQAQWLRIAHYFGCPDIDGRPGLESAAPDQPYLSERFVSFAWPASWSCAGAAHPDFGLEGHTFDAASGRELGLDELLHFGPVPPPKPDTDDWYKYRSEIFAPAVVALMTRLHPKGMAKPSGDEDCDYTDPSIWSFPAWHVGKQGLYLGASFARVARVCDNPEWSYVPLSELRSR